MPKEHRLILGLLCFLVSAVSAGSSAAPAALANDPDLKLIRYSQFIDLLDSIKDHEHYDKYFRIVNGFSQYNISPIPNCGSAPCVNPLIEIADFQKGAEFVRSLPTVLLVAGFHGNEVVGTNSFFRLMEILKKKLLNLNKWNNYLGNVRILMAPMINVNGFHGIKREETVTMNGRASEVDPNRDFPYDDDASFGCFNTSTAELLDAIFRDNLIVGCLTFHGGDNSITYPWGNYPHAKSPKSGDHVAFDAAANILSTVAGGNAAENIAPYRVGTLHDVVYDVHGGFEDWGYGASFDTRYIDKSCGRRSNPKFGLFPSISYNDFTNRAFLFLIEAGFEKIPSSTTLGNTLALETDDFSQGKWGHVARNINLSTRFLQLVGPFASVEKVSYSNSNLILELAVYGCQIVNGITAESLSVKELSKKYDDLRNKWTFSLAVNLDQDAGKKLSLQVKCDENWAQPTNGVDPQSHLVRMRTDKDFKLEYNNYKLKSLKNLSFDLENIRIADLSKSHIHYNGHSRYALTYTATLEVVSATGANGKIRAYYKNGNMQLESEKGTTYTANIHSYTTSVLPSKPSVPKPRHLMQLQTGAKAPMTSQNFLGMVGRSIEFYDNSKNEPVISGILNLEMPTAEDEEKNALPIPANGVSCLSASKGSFGNYDYASIVLPDDSDSLSFELYISGNSASKFKLGQHTGAFQSRIGASAFKHTSTIPLTEIDTRILGRTLSIFDSSDNEIMTCVLGQRDPYTDIPRVLGYTNLDLAKETPMTLFKVLLVLFFVCIIGGVAFLLFKRLFGRKRNVVPERAGVELSMSNHPTRHPYE